MTFFRDPAGLRALAEVAPSVPTDKPIRVWVPAGATGEHAYSVALVMFDVLKRDGRGRKLKIFATAHDAEAVKVARAGVYAAEHLELLPKAHRRHFTPHEQEERAFRVAGHIRECLVFAVHELGEDLPFLNLDIISCPADMNEWEPAKRQKAVRLFHLALRPGGYLLLPKDAAAPAPELFQRVNRTAPLFRRMTAAPVRRGEDLSLVLGRAAKALRSHWRGLERTPSLEARQTQDEFVAMVSHELRTPLTTIMAFTESLRNDHDARERKTFLNAIDRNSKRLLSIVESLIDVAESRSDDRKVQPCDLRIAVRIAAEMLKPLATKAGVGMDIDVPHRLMAAAHPADIPHILENLIGNAIKYTPSGGKITITGEPADGHVVLSVADTGVGIPAACLPKIFDRFYRAPTVRSRGGSGLGLAIVRRLVEANGGSVSAQSQEDVGSTFRVVLPAA